MIPAQLDTSAPARAACLVNAVVCSLPEPPPVDAMRGAAAAFRVAAAAVPAETLMLTAASEELTAMVAAREREGAA
jgi:hypothetical protein